MTDSSRHQGALIAPMAPALERLIDEAVARLRRRLDERMPHAAEALWRWLEALAPDRSPPTYFKHLHAFPTLLFPWWLDEALSPGPNAEPGDALLHGAGLHDHGLHDLGLHGALCYSSVAGYLAIRLVDDAMDAQSPAALELLPAVWFFVAEFQSTYADLFDRSEEHQRFWDTFERTWARTSEAALADGRARFIDEQAFETFASKKVQAGKIPLAAVCEHHGLGDLDPAWSDLFDRYSRWHQLLNDLLDWPRDQADGTATFFLSTAEQRRGARPVEQWVVEEGFGWAAGLLQAWIDELRARAAELGSPGLVRYLALRAEHAASLAEGAAAGLAALARLFAIEAKQGGTR